MSVEVPIPQDGTETNQNSNEHVCNVCGIRYRSKISVGQHKRQSHPVEYNEEINVGRIRARWSEEELLMMAMYEVDGMRNNERFINRYLFGKMQNRSIEAIKGQRRNDRYKQLVIDVMNEPEVDEGSETNHDGHEHLDQNHEDDELASEYVASVRNEVEKSIRVLRTRRRNRYSHSLIALAEEILNGNVNENQLTEWIRLNLGNNNERSRGPNTRRRRNHRMSRNERRRQEYAKLQTLYKKDLGAAIRCVLADPEEQNVMPPNEETIAFWKNIFETGHEVSSNTETVPIEKEDLKGLWSPITIDDIMQCELDTNSAAGPDRVSVGNWRTTGDEVKKLFYNLILLKGRLEVGLTKARTVLIPKAKGALRPEDFRPLSITSVVVRQLHKIFAQRFRKLHKFDVRQRAFIESDGTMENLSIVSALLADARTTKKEIHLATLDLKKAFDSVAHGIVIETIELLGCPKPFVKYMKDLYGNANTTIQYEGTDTPVKIKRGVLQGDPLSQMVFNAVMDRALRKLQEGIGYRINGKIFNCIAYADDLILVASTKMGLQSLIDSIEMELNAFGLEINGNKSSTLSLVPSGKEKKIKVITEQMFKANNQPLKAIGVIDAWKYLGIKFVGSRIDKSKVNIGADLEKIGKAPLKPQQRMNIMSTGVIPKYLHSLILGRTTLGKLNEIDRTIRKHVRKWLHLPGDSPVSYFYTSIKNGGLGIQNLGEGVPMCKLKRIEKFLVTDSSTNQAFNESRFIKNQIEWCKKALVHLGDNITKEEKSKQWMNKMEERVDTKNLTLAKHSKASTSWVREKADQLSGRDYIHYHQIRVGSLPSKARTRRGRPLERNCRAGCYCPETNYHIIQQCHRTHGGRILRHDRVVKMIRDFVEVTGTSVLMEPNFRTIEGLQKPDLLITKDGKTTLVDVQIVSGNNMERDHTNKKGRYRNVQGLEQQIKDKCLSREVRYEAITVSYRGIVEKRTDDVFKELGIKAQQQHMICTSILRGTWLNWVRFNQMTTMVAT